ncbi:XdhC family protein [Candidatus Riflebacteria bacterium]
MRKRKLIQTIEELSISGQDAILVKIIDSEEQTLVTEFVLPSISEFSKIEGLSENPDPENINNEVWNKIKAPLANYFSELIQKKKETLLKYGDSFIYYLQKIVATDILILFGGGDINEGIVHIARLLNYEIYLWDDRPEFSTEKYLAGINCFFEHLNDCIAKLPFSPHCDIVIATRGHKFDLQILKLIHNKPYRYLGIIGSRKKIKSSFREVKKISADFDPSNIHAPVGLDIGAKSSKEIAVAIIAEMLANKNKIQKIGFMKERLNT